MALVSIGRIAPGDPRDASSTNAKFTLLEQVAIEGDNLRTGGLDRRSFEPGFAGQIIGPVIETGSSAGTFVENDFAYIHNTSMVLPTFTLAAYQVARIRARVSFITQPGASAVGPHWSGGHTYGIPSGKVVNVRLRHLTSSSAAFLTGSKAELGQFKSVNTSAASVDIPGHGSVITEGWIDTLGEHEVGIAIDSGSETVRVGRAVIWAHIFHRTT